MTNFDGRGLQFSGRGPNFDDLDLAPDIREALRRMQGHQQRQLRDVEDWASRPHTTYGSRAIQPVYFGENLGNFSISAPQNTDPFVDDTSAGGFPGVGNDVFSALTLELERPTHCFVWGQAEVENVSSEDWNAFFFLPVTTFAGEGSLMIRSNGPHSRQYAPNSSTRQQMFMMRRLLVDMGPSRHLARFEWGFKQGGSTNFRPMDVFRMKMIVWAFNGQDIPESADVVWTTSGDNRTLYKS